MAHRNHRRRANHISLFFFSHHRYLSLSNFFNLYRSEFTHQAAFFISEANHLMNHDGGLLSFYMEWDFGTYFDY